jgi:hypothetical protein
MLQRFKDFIAPKSERFNVFGSFSTNANPASTTNNSSNQSTAPKSAEMIIIENFSSYIQTLTQDENVPKKAINHLTEILNLVKTINFDDMTLENQSLVRRILELDAHQLLDVYLSLPKAHAVSVVLENGKTAKQTVIDNVFGLYNKINEINTQTIEQKTEKLLKKQKVSQMKQQRKDFFDL